MFNIALHKDFLAGHTFFFESNDAFRKASLDNDSERKICMASTKHKKC